MKLDKLSTAALHNAISISVLNCFWKLKIKSGLKYAPYLHDKAVFIFALCDMTWYESCHVEIPCLLTAYSRHTKLDKLSTAELHNTISISVLHCFWKLILKSRLKYAPYLHNKAVFIFALCDMTWYESCHVEIPCLLTAYSRHNTSSCRSI